MVVDGTGLKNAVIGVAGLAVFCGALRLRLLFFMIEGKKRKCQERTRENENLKGDRPGFEVMILLNFGAKFWFQITREVNTREMFLAVFLYILQFLNNSPPQYR